MTTTFTATTARAIADRTAKTKRLTVPLTALQAEHVTEIAGRIGWSKATLTREALFRFTASLESRLGSGAPFPQMDADSGQTR